MNQIVVGCLTGGDIAVFEHDMSLGGLSGIPASRQPISRWSRRHDPPRSTSSH